MTRTRFLRRSDGSDCPTWAAKYHKPHMCIRCGHPTCINRGSADPVSHWPTCRPHERLCSPDRGEPSIDCEPARRRRPVTSVDVLPPPLRRSVGTTSEASAAPGEFVYKSGPDATPAPFLSTNRRGFSPVTRATAALLYVHALASASVHWKKRSNPQPSTHGPSDSVVTYKLSPPPEAKIRLGEQYPPA